MEIFGKNFFTVSFGDIAFVLDFHTINSLNTSLEALYDIVNINSNTHNR